MFLVGFEPGFLTQRAGAQLCATRGAIFILYCNLYMYTLYTYIPHFKQFNQISSIMVILWKILLDKTYRLSRRIIFDIIISRVHNFQDNSKINFIFLNRKLYFLLQNLILCINIYNFCKKSFCLTSIFRNIYKK